MLVITTKPQKGVNPRTNTNHPEKRHAKILDKLSENKSVSLMVLDGESNNDFTDSDIINIIKHVHHPELIDFDMLCVFMN